MTRNAGATSFIPSENEWYKAAYHQPAAQGGDSDNYWAYPMKTNSVPYSDQPPGATPANTRVGNFYQDDLLANGYDDGFAVTGSNFLSGTANYLSDVGAYTSSPSYYGTFDQGGNVAEWNEARIDGGLSGLLRGARGGAWDSDGADYLNASFSGGSSPSFESRNLGFRVATVPEPASITVCIAAVFMRVPRRRRK